jgi:hypothetical protein
VDLKKQVSVDYNKQTINEVLKNLLEKEGLDYTIDDKHIVVYKASNMPSVSTVSAKQQQVKKSLVR